MTLPQQGRSQSENLVTQDLKGPSAFDQTHALLARLSYRAPNTIGKWTASAIFLAKTGTPFTVFSGSDGAGYGNVDGSPGDRPNLLDESLGDRVLRHPESPLL